MTQNEKIAKVKMLLNDNSISSDKVSAYLDLARDEILNRLYQLYDETPSDAKFPSRYESKQIMLACAMLTNVESGGIGLAQHSESAMGTTVVDSYGMGSAYGLSLWSQYLVDITPYYRRYKRR